MKHIFLFLSLLFAVQIGQAQEVWNACNSTVTIIPAPSYDSTFVLSAPSRAALAKGMANWTPSTSSSYTVWTAFVTQSGSSAPTATVKENTTGLTATLSRLSTGLYKVSFGSPVSESDLYGMGIFPKTDVDAYDGIHLWLQYNDEDSDGFFIKTYYLNSATGAITNMDDLLNYFIEVRIYQ